MEALSCRTCIVPNCQVFCKLQCACPKWRMLAENGSRREAYECLAKQNPFPEFTSRLCSGTCESGLCREKIRELEKSLAEEAFSKGWIRLRPFRQRNNRKCLVVGSGLAALAASEALYRSGHPVTVFSQGEEAQALCLRGLNEALVRRRIDLLKEEGIVFVTGIQIGENFRAESLLREYQSILLFPENASMEQKVFTAFTGKNGVCPQNLSLETFTGSQTEAADAIVRGQLQAKRALLAIDRS